MAQNLADRFHALSAPRKKQVHQYLCAKALEVWEQFAAETGQITYNDSVVGMFHIVDLQLPAAALRATFDFVDASINTDIAHRYLEPITALQDGDVDFSGEALMAYYAIYNAFQKYVQHRTIDDWLIVNQSLAAHPEFVWKPLLKFALNR